MGRMRNHRESGQVLITGIVMMVILLLIILYAFDVHNVIRAKLKVDVAQEAAAMTGALWQRETLNLLGEINLLKASALLLEGADGWKTPLPDKEKEEEKWRSEMQARVDLLTEMQTRISFMGPLIGFAAAQQAAMNNGLTRVPNAFGTYLELLKVDKRYDEAQGGAPRYINNYDWKEPYINMVTTINDFGIAVYPNARVAGMPETFPKQLANPNFYTELLNAAEAIAADDPPKRHYWYLSNSLLRSMDDKDFQGKWWNIDYSRNRFPMESEIFTVGVDFGGEYKTPAYSAALKLKPDLQLYGEPGALPASMKWCIYDDWWLPEYYRTNYPEYEEEHFNYWFKGGVLRREIKPEYFYEGPAAYTEGFADVPSIVTVRPSVRPYSGTRKRDALDAVKRQENSILLKKQKTVSRVGTRRGYSEDSNVSTSYRPGSIAKVLGGLQQHEPPIAVDLILPVFKQISPMPTYMPIPYGFQVLKPGYSNLEKFLSWLAEQNDLNGVPPPGTEHFLRALHFLVYGVRERAAGKGGAVSAEPGSRVAGRGLRYYGYNPKFSKSAFENEFKEKLWTWHPVRDKRVFQQTVLDGPGWLQEPQLFSNNPAIAPKPAPYRKKLGPGEEPRFKGSKIVVDENGERWEVNKLYYLSRHDGIFYLDEETHKVAMPDSINGGTAYRIYVEVKGGAREYYVIDSRGNIVLNGSPDPTILYNNRFGGGGGGNNVWNPGKFDNTRGPTRL